MAFTFEPIGVLHGGGFYPQEAPHQSTLAVNTGRIELTPGRNFETALADLEGFDRVWLLFVFDRNESWKPKVRPPVGGVKQRIGVFATRSPHRPNPIGLSAVELVGVRERTVLIRNFDLLDGTPILDIKPYIPQVDSFPESRAGWRDLVPEPDLTLTFSPEVLRAADWIAGQGGPDLINAARVQLTTRDLDPTRQRLTLLEDSAGRWMLAFRTWRLLFCLKPGERTARVEAIASGYSDEELVPEAPDPYHDKALHRLYRNRVS